jgi:glycosyltransferase involved in cell wall biosynthesis
MAIAHTPIFSIIIPSYNYAHYLPRALSSVESQGGNDCEAIVVDDGSTDSTAEVVKNIQMQTQAPIVYVHQANSGPSAARNRGVEEARGQFVLFLDADDALHQGALTSLRAILQKQPRVDFILGAHMLVTTNGKTKFKEPLKITHNKDDNFRLYLRGDLNAVCCGSLAVRRTVFDRLRFPGSDMMWEDIILWAHLLALYDGVAIGDPLVTIYRHVDSLGHNEERVKREYEKPLDRLFDSAILPPRLMAMRMEFLSCIYLEQFTFLYKRGHGDEAKAFFIQAIKIWPPHILRFRSLRRFLSIVIRLREERQR